MGIAQYYCSLDCEGMQVSNLYRKLPYKPTLRMQTYSPAHGSDFLKQNSGGTLQLALDQLEAHDEDVTPGTCMGSRGTYRRVLMEEFRQEY